MTRLARLLGCTEGQAYTLVIGAVLAVGLIVTGLPPALRRAEPVGRAAASERRPDAIPGYTDDDALASATTTSTPVEIAAARPPAAPALEAGITRRPRPVTATTATPSASGTDGGPSSTTTTADPPAPAPAGQLSIRSAAYARAVGGKLAVPDGGLPVGARLGREDTRTYLRLSGAGASLRVARHPDSSATMFPESASIAMCRVIPSDWEIENGSALADAPAIDTSSCVRGAAGTDGSWSFPVASLGEVTDARGVALVAMPAAGATFQVTFTSR